MRMKVLQSKSGCFRKVWNWFLQFSESFQRGFQEYFSGVSKHTKSFPDVSESFRELSREFQRKFQRCLKAFQLVSTSFGALELPETLLEHP